jgi:hypothetical protein
MFEIIKGKIKDKNLILFGEIHGTKEIPKLLSQFFSEIAKEEEFNISLEIPQEFQANIEDFFKIKEEDSDGRNSLEYLELIKNIENLNKKYNKKIKIFCVDMNSDSLIENEEDIQNIREKIIAENIIKIINNKKTFVVLGNIHASKKNLSFHQINIIPSGAILFNKLKDKMFSINILPKKGVFFNTRLKKISEDDFNDSFDKGFDYVFKIKEVNPCSFFRENSP